MSKVKSSFLALISLLFILLFIFKPAFLWQPIVKGSKLLQLSFEFLRGNTSKLKSDNNRTNFLLLGISGKNHDGKYLTDTMIFISSDKTTADTVVFSIPRDIWVDSFKAKLNAAYEFGELRQSGSGFNIVKNTLTAMFDQPIHYTALLDFKGFEDIIDYLGGLDINVERPLDDYLYPIEGRENDLCNGDLGYKCRYEELHFNSGWQHMTGAMALKYVRSRHAEGEEGTDFARSQRQQKVLLALKDKIFSSKVLLNPQKALTLKRMLEKQIKTDQTINEEEYISLINLFIKFVKNKNRIRTINIDTGTDENPGFLYNPPSFIYGQWVLVPRNNNWNDVQRYIKEKIFSGY